MTLQFRFASEHELPDLGRLAAHSFPAPSRDAAWWQEQLQHPRYGGGAETILLGQDNGRTVASLQAHPLRQWIAGDELPVTGIGTVAISPVHRRRRFAAELMTAALRAGRERGDLASALYPFRASFYQKLGYGQAGEALQYQIPPDALPDSPERERVELLATAAARAEALQLYGSWVRTQTGQLERNDAIWSHLCSAPERVLVGYRAQDGVLAGYALATYHSLRPQRYLEVEEIVWLTHDARRGLYGWLASLSDQWEQIVLRALPSHKLGDWIREPRLPHGTAPSWGLWAPGATLMMGPMFRLLDMTAWNRRRIQEAPALTVAIDLHDPQIAENHGRWRLRLENGRIAVDRNDTAELSLKLDVSTLSRLYIAGMTPGAALEANLLECNRPELLSRLDAALALPEPWMFDRF